ncbi:MAG: hypothetical protein GWN58_51065, partial [Anaerolineae bacterium]|nr:hypothetical protein [Anaerolineae bacterium]
MNDHRAILQESASAAGDGTAMCVAGHGTACFQIEGTFVGTVTWKARLPGSSVWVTIQATNLNTGAAATTATAAGIYRIDVR